jgi:hypothetical protein
MKDITQAELDALPEDGRFGEREEVIDGKRVRVPVLETVGVLWTPDDEPCMVRDIHGDYWTLGWANGVRYKRRMR